MREYLKDLSMHYDGDYHKITNALKSQKKVPRYKSDYGYICIGDKDYPKRLYDLQKAPYVLFYIGDIRLLKETSISVVGSRNPSNYALEATGKLVHNLKNNVCIVSGLAKGIDAKAHQAALDFSTIAVLGCGIDVVYPQCNRHLFEEIKKSQLILSEYPQGVTPKRYFFPFRNRIIAALSDRLYVMSATKRSGTMTTVNEALTLNRHVLVLPHPLGLKSGEGCNQLILEGADILTSLSD
ncbi:MAG TPA: DNA-processing protein DprA [Erysipelothrix sp.]|nr:DNA-processing protein DprA [Erysipelothrix sp.]